MILMECNSSLLGNFLAAVKNVVNIIWIFGPILAILSLIICFINMMRNPDDEKASKKVFNSIKALIILFFIPTFINVLMLLLGNNFNFSACWNGNYTFNYESSYTPPDSNNDRSSIIINPEEYEKGGKSSVYGFSGEIIKIGIIGNSYSYVNDPGSMLAALGKKTGKKMVVVYMGHGGASLSSIAGRNDNWYEAWDNTSGQQKCASNFSIEQLLNKDYFNLGRPGKWDVLILQNNATATVSGTYNSDLVMIPHIINKVSSPDRILFNATYFGSQKRADGHAKTCNRYKCGVMNCGVMFRNYSDWENLRIHDSADHQSGKGAYMYAVAWYSRLFGKESIREFIPLYNSDSGTVKEFASSCRDHIKGSNSEQNVNKETARKIQQYVYNNYNKYIMFK